MAITSVLTGSLASLRDLVRKAGFWKILAITWCILSWKNLPFVWHLRFYRALIQQLFLSPHPLPRTSLFSPLITSSRTSLWETDFNLHKSNSTYFSDLDIARTHFTVALLKRGIFASRVGGKEERKEGDKEGSRPILALGGVSCHFRREVKPLQTYEVWTRLLSWDRKWIYVVSYIVKPGVARPRRYVLQPWRKGTQGRKEETEEMRKARFRDAVLATSVSKYVCKKGRLTIPAETVLRNSGMLPERPVDEAVVARERVEKAESGEELESVHDTMVKEDEGAEWTWEKVEAERLRGLRWAEAFGALDELHDEFDDGGEDGALGVYPDMFW